ncbi:odorant receptor 67c-like [Venturia canescens]|uniref:odorant receptor 67c-like n=1 Tax=Venturia canescens TaxID=32260 RepID=UPI001C9D495B|nr:odorant receptor 67c-like [Venturia canescens]
MDQLSITYLKINKNFLASIGLWPHQYGFIKYLLLCNLLLFIGSQGYFQIGGMIAAWENKSVFLESIPPVLVDFVCGTKIINFLINSEKMKHLLFTLEADWVRFKGRDEIEVMKKYAIHGRNFTLSYTGCMYASMTPFMVVPMVPLLLNALEIGNKTYAKQLMFRVDYLFDAEKYYYPLLIHSYFGTVAYITLIIAIDTILMVFVVHACGSFAVLGYQLQNMMEGVDINVNVYPPRDNDSCYYTLSDCIVQHNHALEYSKRIEDANYISYFIQLGIIMVCLSFTGFQTVMYANSPEIAARYVGFTMTQLVILFLQSYPGQMLYDHSVRVSEYVHNSNWYLTSVRSRRLICLMIMRSRIPCALTAGRFYILNLANFSAVIRTSLSYLTVLTSVK